MQQQPKVEYRRFVSKRRFGVELEVSNTRDREFISQVLHKASPKKEVRVTDWAQSNGNGYWHVKWDATCGPKGRPHDNGWEVASYISSGFKDVVHIAQVANALRQAGVEITQNCGLHIHADIQEFTSQQAATLVARWIKLERTIIQAVPPFRTKSKYCRLLSDIASKKIDFKHHYEAAEFWRLVRPTNYGVHDNNQKKVALNMVNYAATQAGYQHRSTVELRLPEGTLFGSDVRNWVRCFVNFVDLAATAPMPVDLVPGPDPIEELMQFFGLEDGNAFYILSRGLYEAKVWLLKRLKAYACKELAAAATKKLEICTASNK